MTADTGQHGASGTESAILLLTRAYDFAARAHAPQRRRGEEGNPYINHPCAVAMMTAQALGGKDAEAVAAAVLHDVVEDTQATEADIATLFGARIAGLVKELTDDAEWTKHPLAERKRLQAEKAKGLSAEARTIKIADQTSNIRDLTSAVSSWPRDRHQAYLDGARLVVDACRGVAPALEAAFDESASALEAAIEKEFSK